MATQLMWLQLMAAATLLLVGHACPRPPSASWSPNAARRNPMPTRRKATACWASRYQGQGQLDMALDNFRKCPLDDAVMENCSTTLRSTSSASASSTRPNRCSATWPNTIPKFRDIWRAALNRAKAMSETVILGGGAGSPRRHGDPERRRCRKADARPLSGREGTRQGRDGRRLSRQGSEDRPRGRDQDHGAVAGVRGRRAAGGQGALSSARRRRPAGSTIRISSPSSMPAKSTISPTSRWSS